MRMRSHFLPGLLAAAALVAGALGAAASSSAAPSPTAAAVVPSVSQHLTASSPQVAKCLPRANVNVKVELKTDLVGFDDFHITGSGLPAKTAFTVFLLRQADAPFGAAEYIGDLFTDALGRGSNSFHVIVAEAFSSSLLNGQRVRTELNQVGMWFADPAGDDFCLGKGKGPITPFDGDNAAGVQGFNSLQAIPLPAP